MKCYSLIVSLAIATSIFGRSPAFAALQDAVPPLFSAVTPLDLSLTGDFFKIEAANAGGNYDDDDRTDPKYWSDAQLTSQGHALTGRVRARGMSSGLDGEGTFPKILLEIGAGEDLKQTLFKGNRQVRINTHVSTHPTSDYTRMGRLNSELSPWREALGYEMAAAAGLPVPGIRRAEINYSEVSTGETFVRKALLIETDKNFGERLHARKISLPDFAKTQETKIDLEASALLHLFEALIGNEDFVLRTSAEAPSSNGINYDYGNVIVYERADGSRFVAPYDFDRSTLVGGEKFLDYTEYAPTTVAAVMERRVGWLRARHPDAAVRSAAEHLLCRHDQIAAAIARADVDEEGRAIAFAHLERFTAYMTQRLDLHLTCAGQ